LHNLKDGVPRSSFYYKLDGNPPHTGSTMRVQSVSKEMVSAIVWYSHGGAVLSLALARRDAAPATPDAAPRVTAASEFDPPRASPALPGVPDAQEGTGDSYSRSGAVGLYISDIVSFEYGRVEAAEDFADADGKRYCHVMVIRFQDGLKLRFCFATRFARNVCQGSLARLRSAVYPSCQDIQVVTPRGPRRAQPQLFHRPTTAASDSSQPPIAAASAPPGAPDGWNGLVGTLEITVLSASLLGTKESEEATERDALAHFSGNSVLAKVQKKFKAKSATPSPQVFAWVAAQAPPIASDCRKTPPLQQRSANPVWNCTWYYTVEYSAQDPPPANVRLEVWDVGGSGDYLGEMSLPFPLKPGYYQHQARLRCNKSKMSDPSQSLTGSLSVQLRWKSDTEQDYENGTTMQLVEAGQSNSVCGTFGINCIRAVDLRIADFISSDPYYVVRVGAGPDQSCTFRSSTLMATTSPEWHEVHETLINWPRASMEEKAVVSIEIWDYDKTSSDEFLGEVAFPLPTQTAETVLELDVKANRAKGSGAAQGRVQVRMYLREEFWRAIEAEPELTPYERAFCLYFGTRPVDEQTARAMAPYLVYFHLSIWRILRGHLRRAWHVATCGLTDPGPALLRGRRFRGYFGLTSALWSALAAGAYCLLAPAVAQVGGSVFGSAVIGVAVAMFVPSPAHLLARLFWHNPEDPAVLLRAPPPSGASVEERSPPRIQGVPLPISVTVLVASLILLAGFIGYTGNDEAVNLQLTIVAVVLVLMRLAVWPLVKGLCLTWIVASSKRSRAFDWFIWLYPSTITTHDAVM